MATPENIEYEELVVTGLEIWFKNGQKYQASLVPPDNYELGDGYVQVTIYPYDERCSPGKIDINLSETVAIFINQWVLKFPVNRLRKVIPASPSEYNPRPPGSESGESPAPDTSRYESSPFPQTSESEE